MRTFQLLIHSGTGFKNEGYLLLKGRRNSLTALATSLSLALIRPNGLHDVIHLAGNWGGWGPRTLLRSITALGLMRRQRAVDPAPPEALNSGKKPVHHRPGNRSPDFCSSFRWLFGASWQGPEAPGCRTLGQPSFSQRN